MGVENGGGVGRRQRLLLRMLLCSEMPLGHHSSGGSWSSGRETKTAWPGVGLAFPFRLDSGVGRSKYGDLVRLLRF